MAAAEPKIALKNFVWTVSNQRSDPTINVTPGAAREGVYLLKCSDSVVTIHGTCARITFEQCNNCEVVYDSVLSSVEFIKSNGCKSTCNHQARGAMTHVLDSSVGCSVKLSTGVIAGRVFTARSKNSSIFVYNADIQLWENYPLPDDLEDGHQISHKFSTREKRVETSDVSREGPSGYIVY
eukprot:TRINITY_DN5769_c0_g1_i1.p1 TRINITY_DN5769_c0_g1~~TRINITY_DN5769_c0_g1_i1.p1  ORF type:complete len:181 (-),score=19.65 TRINITY_DN5769_c0_g1_i1:73-615(-)